MSMNINSYTSAVSAYLHAAGDYDNGAKKTSAPVKARNTDKVEFSAKGKAAAAEGLTDVTSSARAAAAKAAGAPASADRIAALKNAVASGNYYISSADIASSILEA